MDAWQATEDEKLHIIGERIRLARMNAHLTQDELAEKTGLAIKTVQRYEYGTSSMTLAHLFRIATAVGVTINWFCGENSEREAERSPFADVEGIVAQFTLEQFKFYSKQMASTAMNILENYQ
jgi:transcriptional regulator with XRE-family HTH domain